MTLCFGTDTQFLCRLSLRILSQTHIYTHQHHSCRKNSRRNQSKSSAVCVPGFERSFFDFVSSRHFVVSFTASRIPHAKRARDRERLYVTVLCCVSCCARVSVHALQSLLLFKVAKLTFVYSRGSRDIRVFEPFYKTLPYHRSDR